MPLPLPTRTTLLLTAPLLLLLLLLLSALSPSSPTNPNNLTTTLSTYRAHQLHLVTFTQRLEFYDLNATGDDAWNAILPPNGGFVVQEMEDGRRAMAGVSMFHQLHCLMMIRGAILGLQGNGGMGGGTSGIRMAAATSRGLQRNKRAQRDVRRTMDDEGDIGGLLTENEADVRPAEGVHGHMNDGGHGGHADSQHWVHCLDYLMQGILCAADDTIEAAESRDHGPRIDGYGVTHQCRNPDRLWTLAGGHSPFNDGME
ncbi:hypothetical protein LTS18_013488 [Coniosporium uncinatum]|uniref:Uncharacterized protein n=1 Tax=Coniosporium uncinatum TaxID=93489 RepID=A0ACC3D8U9_9PEZI|nr:hypothetical protein LTS18_013488 [Coniosporium uncinatum]